MRILSRRAPGPTTFAVLVACHKRRLNPQSAPSERTKIARPGLLELFNIEHLPRFLRRPASAFTLADLLPSQHFWFQGRTFVRFDPWVGLPLTPPVTVLHLIL